MRLIDADALTEEFKKTHDGKRSLLIDTAPSVDAVPVVRCKDCKHWDGVDTCDVIDAPVWDNDFCSMAERRSNE